MCLTSRTTIPCNVRVAFATYAHDFFQTQSVDVCETRFSKFAECRDQTAILLHNTADAHMPMISLKEDIASLLTLLVNDPSDRAVLLRTLPWHSKSTVKEIRVV